MARYITFGIWTCFGLAALFLIVSNAQELNRKATEHLDSVEEITSGQTSGPGARVNNRRRPGGVIKYKKMSVKSKFSGIETPSTVSPDLGQSKPNRRLKPKSSPRYTMIYKPSKKKTSSSSSEDDSFEKSTTTKAPPRPKTEEPSTKSRGYTTKSWQPEELVTEGYDSFIRPTKRNRVRVNHPLENGSTSTTTSSPIRQTVDPLRPISRHRSSTTTTLAPTTTSQFVRLTRKPWRNNPENVRTSAEIRTKIETTSAIPEVTTKKEIEIPEPDEIEHLEEESIVRKVQTSPDQTPPRYVPRDSSQEKTTRPRMHIPKKSSDSLTLKNRPNEEPILLQTKEQRVQQQQQHEQRVQQQQEQRAKQQQQQEQQAKQQQQQEQQAKQQQQQEQQKVNDEKVRQEESQDSQPVRHRPTESDREIVEETKKRIEKYEAEKTKQIDRLRQNNKNAGIQQPEEAPKARRIPSTSENQNSAEPAAPPRQTYEDDNVDFTRVPPSNFGQRLPPSGQSDYRPGYVYQDAGPEPPRYIYKPEHEEVYRRPEVVYSTTLQPNINQEVYRRPEIIYKTTSRPEIIYNSTPRPEVIYTTSTRPIEDDYRRPEVIYTPPKHDYQPPSAYLTGHGTYPRVRISYYPSQSPTTITPPSVTYEPPHLEFMPPAPSPPPRIYVPPQEEFKPPSSTALALQVRRPENETPSVNYRPRLEDLRIIEGIRQLEAINSYARLVSVGHPAVNELPYPPVGVKEGQLPSRPQQPVTEPVIIRVPENSYNEQSKNNKEKGERYQDKPLLTRPGYYQTEVAKPYWKEETVVIGTPSDSYVQRPQQESERYRSRYEGSSTIIGKPYSRDEVVLKVSQSFERPTGRRVPDPPRSAELSYQINQANQVQQSSQVYQQQQQTNSETQKYYQPEINQAQQSSTTYQQQQTNSETQKYYQPEINQAQQPSTTYQQQQQTNSETQKYYQPEINPAQQSSLTYQQQQQTNSETQKYYQPEVNQVQQPSPTYQQQQQQTSSETQKYYLPEKSQVNQAQQSSQSYLPVQQTYQQQITQQTNSESQKYYQAETNQVNQAQQSSQPYVSTQQIYEQLQQTNPETQKYFQPEISKINQQAQHQQSSYQSAQQIYQQQQQPQQTNSEKYYQPEVSQANQAQQSSQTYQSAQQTYQQQQQPQQTDSDTQKYYQPVSDRPYIITSSSVIDLDGRYENVIPVSEQPKQKPYAPPEAYIIRTEKPPQESERPSSFVVSDKPITVTVRPHGIPSPEPERVEVVYRSQEPKGPIQPEVRPDLTSNQNQPIIKPDKQESRPEFSRNPAESLKVPSTFYPIGPVRAYQVTQAIYSSPPNRFFQLPAPLPNPFESKFQPPPSPPAPPPSPPAPSTFESNFPPGDTWSVNPIQYPASISTSRPFTGSSLPQLPEEPHSSERLVIHYRPATPYFENHRLNRSLNHFVPIYQEQEQQHKLVYDRPIVTSEDVVRYQSQEPPYQPSYDNPVVLNEEYYINQQKSEENSNNDDQQKPDGDLTGVKGTPGVDYPIFDAVPSNLKFKCEMVDSPGTRHPAYYADPYTRCQVFHVCQSNRAKDSFLCPNGTIFNQKVRVCDWWHNVQCEESAAFYNVNTDINEPDMQHQQPILIL